MTLEQKIEHLERQLAEANAALGSAAECGDQQLYARIAELEAENYELDAIRKAAEATIEAYRDMRKTAKSGGESARAAEARKLKQESFVLSLDILNELCVKTRKEPSR